MKNSIASMVIVYFLMRVGNNGYSDINPTNRLSPKDRLNRSAEIIHQATSETGIT